MGRGCDPVTLLALQPLPSEPLPADPLPAALPIAKAPVRSGIRSMYTMVKSLRHQRSELDVVAGDLNLRPFVFPKAFHREPS